MCGSIGIRCYGSGRAPAHSRLGWRRSPTARRRLLVADRGQYDALYHPKREAAGAILVDCRIVGTWARQQSRVTLRPWAPLDPSTEDAVTATALDLAGPMGRPIVLRKAA